MLKDTIQKFSEKKYKKTYKYIEKDYKDLIHALGGSEVGNKDMLNLARSVHKMNEVHGLQAYDVQLVAAIGIVKGGVYEINTGEGKTLIAALAACTLALSGRKVHIYTPNDYLSERDSAFTAKVARTLGISCAFVSDNMSSSEVKEVMHQSDILYMTERMAIFSYIRDQNNTSESDDVFPGFDALIIDEADSILIDNGETPYILSGSEDNLNKNLPYALGFAQAMSVEVLDHKTFSGKQMSKNYDARIDSHTLTVELSDACIEQFERYCLKRGFIGTPSELYSRDGIEILDALKIMTTAIHGYKRDVDYVVCDGEVQPIDKNTGRILPSVRFNNYVHQAIELKEMVDVKPDKSLLGKMTLETFILKYKMISGMTGTLSEVETEVKRFFGLSCGYIPPNKKVARKDMPDKYFYSKDRKYKQICRDAKKRSDLGQPVLIGCANVEEAELIHGMLRDDKIDHVLLTPKHLEVEADIIAQAGRPGRITVTTSIAGRGTDICLGIDKESLFNDQHSNEEKLAIAELADRLKEKAYSAGGLHVIGTERTRSPRTDRQLIGRSGRQGDPGSSQFYVCPDDDVLMEMSNQREWLRRIFEKSSNEMVHNFFGPAIKAAQKGIQLNALENKRLHRRKFEVHNVQMHYFYEFRDNLKRLGESQFMHWLMDTLNYSVHHLLISHVDPETFTYNENRGKVEDLYYVVRYQMGLKVCKDRVVSVGYETCHKEILSALKARVLEARDLHQDSFFALLKDYILDSVDEQWRENMKRVEQIYSTIHLRAYANQNPEIRYKIESLESYKMMAAEILLSVGIRTTSVMNALDSWEARDFLDKKEIA